MHLDELVTFGLSAAVGAADPEKLGIKGANLVTMAWLDLPVPPGFILGTGIGAAVALDPTVLNRDVLDQVRVAVQALGDTLAQGFGDPENPLLISVRSGAAVSMPGMMDTVLNLGLGKNTVEAFARKNHDERFAWDTYRRFIQSYSQVVLDLDGEEFELVLDELRAKHDCDTDSALPTEAMKEAAAIFSEIVEELSGQPFPQDPHEQLEKALLAVFQSWNTTRAQRYRDINSLSHDGGTAAIVQAMVFGNRDEQSCTGVYFTRNPSTGEAKPYGEYMLNAQGEDVVSGIRTPHELTEAARARAMSDTPSMEKRLPECYENLLACGAQVEQNFADMQEVEFTVESDKLWLLQTRNAKRTPQAALKVAVAMAQQGLITKEDAVARCDDALLQPMLVTKANPSADDKPFAKGLPASPGAVSGEIVFSSDEAVEAKAQDRNVILVRPETDPKDVHGMHAAAGILTSRGGMTSHAAVVARGMNKPCITAAMTVKLNVEEGTCTSLGTTFGRGETITIDGGSGMVFGGEIPVTVPEPDGDLAVLLGWKSES